MIHARLMCTMNGQQSDRTHVFFSFTADVLSPHRINMARAACPGGPGFLHHASRPRYTPSARTARPRHHSSDLCAVAHRAAAVRDLDVKDHGRVRGRGALTAVCAPPESPEPLGESPPRLRPRIPRSLAQSTGPPPSSHHGRGPGKNGSAACLPGRAYYDVPSC